MVIDTMKGHMKAK